jgi:ribonuclease BN (tRNA processing enzyme)
MKITFIGTSHGVPEANRRCSSAMITIGEGNDARRYFIDMGTQAIEDMRTRGIPIESAKAVFLTHPHGDHTHGVISFIDLCCWYFKNANPTVFFPENEEIDALKGWLHVCGTEISDGVELKLCHEGKMYDDGILSVTAYRTKHCGTSYAYLIEAEGKRVLFTGDLSHNPIDDFPYSAAHDCKLIICECAHFDASVLEGIFMRCEPESVIINHYSHVRMLGLYELEKKLPMPFALATDNMEVEI